MLLISVVCFSLLELHESSSSTKAMNYRPLIVVTVLNQCSSSVEEPRASEVNWAPQEEGVM